MTDRCARIRPDEVVHRDDILFDVVGRQTGRDVRKRVFTFPICARPRPPFGAHSSRATRSSLLLRKVRKRVVVLIPSGPTLV